jgi:lysyl-tRNA synthetase, class II
MSRIDQYQESRKINFNKLIENNIEVYPYTYNKTHEAKDILEKYLNLENDQYSDEIASVAGRVLLIRNLGKIAFLDLYDKSGKIQIVVKTQNINEKEKIILDSLDRGDIIGISGKIFKTKRGEVSIEADKITFLSKAFLPLPEKWHGVKDSELIYRKRYLDWMINKDSRDVFIIRAKIITLIRQFLDSKGFLEVETPLMQPLYGGANARPFTTESFVWKRKLYLSISPELYLKRLLVGGFEKVYTICKNFRNEGVDKSHNPEFTMLELYEAYKDYNSAMDILEEMLEYVTINIFKTTKITYDGKEFDFKRPWQKMTMKDAIKKYSNIDIDKLTDQEIKEILTKEKIELEEYKRGLAIAEIFEHFCEDKLTGPIHIIDHPKETTPLCKLHRNDQSLIERNEPYLNSMELANIYSELNDSFMQEKLMIEQKDQGKSKGENHPIDTDFIESLKYGMPPAYGIGMGIDRLVILLTNSQNIRDVILFPLLKEEESSKEKEESDKDGA